MVSIVVPAYNEGKTIERCLRTMLDGAEDGEFEIVVVCNGCVDDTAERARKFVDQGVQVIDTPQGGKANALNLGDEAATRFPRFYVDADIELSPSAIRDVVRMLAANPEVVVAAPSAIVDYKQRNRWVRAYYRVWTRLPYFTEGVIGSGVYAFSEAGRARFDKFPEIIADDEFARLQAKPHERRASKSSTFTITPPTSLRGILNINTRVRAGNYELREKFPDLVDHDNTSPARSLETIAKTPSMWRDAPVYLGVMLLAKLRAHRKLRLNRAKIWERDESSRAAFSDGDAR